MGSLDVKHSPAADRKRLRNYLRCLLQATYLLTLERNHLYEYLLKILHGRNFSNEEFIERMDFQRDLSTLYEQILEASENNQISKNLQDQSSWKFDLAMKAPFGFAITSLIMWLLGVIFATLYFDVLTQSNIDIVY